MANTLNVKRGDVGIPFEDDADLVDLDGNAVDLTGATVLFLLRTPAGLTLSRTGIVDVAKRVIRYKSVLDDFDEVGGYYQEWQLTTSNGDITTIPGRDQNKIFAGPDLNPT
jgi:hypothetical protein